MKPKPFLVIAQIGGRRYIQGAHHETPESALAYASQMNQTQKALTRKPGQSMTRFAVYQSITEEFPQ